MVSSTFSDILFHVQNFPYLFNFVAVKYVYLKDLPSSSTIVRMFFQPGSNSQHRRSKAYLLGLYGVLQLVVLENSTDASVEISWWNWNFVTTLYYYGDWSAKTQLKGCTPSTFKGIRTQKRFKVCDVEEWIQNIKSVQSTLQRYRKRQIVSFQTVLWYLFFQ